MPIKISEKTVSLDLILLEGRIVFKYLRNISWGINGATLSISCNADQGHLVILFLKVQVWRRFVYTKHMQMLSLL